MQNLIQMAFEVLLILAIPAIAAEQKYGAADANATEEERKALRDQKITYYNEKSQEMLDAAVENKVLPKWVANIVSTVRGVIAGIIVDIANYRRFFAHRGNPPAADL